MLMTPLFLHPLQVALESGPTLTPTAHVPTLTRIPDFPQGFGFLRPASPQPRPLSAGPASFRIRPWPRSPAETRSLPTLSMRPHMLKIMPSRFM